MSSLFDIGYHGTNADLDELLKKGYRFGRKSGNSLPFQWGGQKAYVTPNANLASTYGKNKLPVITSGGARSFPGGSVGSKGFTFGKEVALTANQFDKGAALAKKLQSGAYPNSTMANYARTTMSQAPIKQSFLKGIMPTLMNMGSKMAKFPNPITTVLQGLSPTVLGDGMLPEGQSPYITFEQPPVQPTQPITPAAPTWTPPPTPTQRNVTKFSPTRSTAIKGGRGGRGNVSNNRMKAGTSRNYGVTGRRVTGGR
jgi:hypothetical protein